MSPPSNDAAPLLRAGDPLPWASWRSEGSSPALLVCDHASAQIPGALRQLGLTPAALARHIAWDIGAAALTRSLANRLDAPAVLAGYSRLVIDCNRHPDDASSILAVSDGERVPGNEGLNPDARAARRVSCFEPYHAALAAALRSLATREPSPVLIAVHSFTPALGGSNRPWHVGVLWDRDDRVAAPLLEWLRSRRTSWSVTTSRTQGATRPTIPSTATPHPPGSGTSASRCVRTSSRQRLELTAWPGCSRSRSGP